MKVAVIGIGNIGTAHASCIARREINGMELYAVCDIGKKADLFLEKYKNVVFYADYRKMLDQGGFDAVIIAVPHPLHGEIARYAFQRGYHVLLEKPEDISVSNAEKVNEAAKRAGKVFGIMFNQRTDPLFQKTREIVQNGFLGDLKRTVWIVTNWYRTQHYYDSCDWRATWAGEGGGVLLNQAPHNLDLWQWICGMPQSVTAFCNVARYHKIEVEDEAVILTRYKNGAIGTFITSTGEYPGTNRLEISGDLGKIVLEQGKLKWWKLKCSETEIRNKSGESFVNIPYDYVEFQGEETLLSHKKILQNFANAVLYGEELIAPGIDGIYELMISNAAYLSEWKGNKEITLPFDTEEFDYLLEKRREKSHILKSDNDSVLREVYRERWQVKW